MKEKAIVRVRGGVEAGKYGKRPYFRDFLILEPFPNFLASFPQCHK